MGIKVLEAVKLDLCQTEAGELLVNNPLPMRKGDNDFFVGIHSRRPVRYGRVSYREDLSAQDLAIADQTGRFEATSEELDEERIEDVKMFLEDLQIFDQGNLIGCSFVFDDLPAGVGEGEAEEEEYTFELYELEDSVIVEPD